MTGRWLHLFGVPQISATALGAFRAILGASLFLIVLTHPIQAVPVDAQRVYSPIAGLASVRLLAASGTATWTVHGVALAAAAAFAFGLHARASYCALVAALFVRTLFILLQAGAHDWGTPVLSLMALMVVPWGEAPPLAAVVRQWGSGDSKRSRVYGFAVWLPGLTMGLAFAAAALEKLRRSGVEWVTDGAVRYHFVEDAANAPFDLGLWVATQPRLAVALSLFGILVEALFIGVVFVRAWKARAAFGLAAAALLCGFWVFQGIHWWPWLLLLAAFVPWDRTSQRVPDTGSLGAVHALIVAMLVSGQIWASYRRVEIEPLFSHYPMYSGSYASPADYEHAHEQLFFRANGTDITDRIRAVNGSGVISRALERANVAVDASDEIRQSLTELRKRYAGAYGEAPDTVDAFLFKRPFDWEAGHFRPEVLEPLGTVQLAH